MRTRVVMALAAAALAGCGPSLPVRVAQPAPSGPDVCHAGDVTYCALNAAVTQATIATTICQRGWTATVRPAVSYTDALKRQQLARFAGQHPGDPGWATRGTEEDHRMPLELGGAPADPDNLSPEEPASPNPKDADEMRLRTDVCAGRMMCRIAALAGLPVTLVEHFAVSLDDFIAKRSSGVGPCYPRALTAEDFAEITRG